MSTSNQTGQHEDVHGYRCYLSPPANVQIDSNRRRCRHLELRLISSVTFPFIRNRISVLRFRSTQELRSVSLPFPFIRSSRIEFHFFRIRSVRQAYKARKRQRQRRSETAVRTRITETVTETDVRKRNARNQAL